MIFFFIFVESLSKVNIETVVQSKAHPTQKLHPELFAGKASGIIL